jgi:predicted ester cyclase
MSDCIPVRAGRLLPHGAEWGAGTEAVDLRILYQETHMTTITCEARGPTLSDQHREMLMSYVDTYNRGDWDGLAAHVSPEYVHHSGDQLLDLAGFVRGSLWFRNGFPDFAVEVMDVLSDSDRAAMRFLARGTHQVSLFGETPTLRTVALDGITIYRFENGLIAEDWEMMDEGQLRRQIEP